MPTPSLVLLLLYQFHFGSTTLKINAQATVLSKPSSRLDELVGARIHPAAFDEEQAPSPLEVPNTRDPPEDLQIDPSFSSPQDDSIFHAYDCSNPSAMEVVHTTTDSECTKEILALNSQDSQVLLLQEAHYNHIPLYRCELTRTIIPTHCGMSDHMALYTHLFSASLPTEVGLKDCQTMWERGLINYPIWSKEAGGTRTHTHPVNRNGTTHIRYTSVGVSEMDGTEVSCEGARFIDSNGAVYDDMVITHYDVYTLTMDTLLHDDSGRLTTQRGGYDLSHCRLRDQNCQKGTIRFLWKYDSYEPPCKLFLARKMDGSIITMEDSRRVFISSPTYMVKLVLKGSVSRCGRPVYSTNYHNLFLTTDLTYREFNRPLTYEEYSPITYTNQQDDYLYYQLVQYIKKSIERALYNDCLEDVSKRRKQYELLAAHQRAPKFGETIHLGGSLFATATGEAWHTYRCKAIAVKARSTSFCSHHLPVTLQPEHASSYLRHVNKSLAHTEFFIIPHSHLLTTVTSTRSCIRHIPTMFRNYKGDWYAFDPSPRRVNAPKPLIDDTDLSTLNGLIAPELDFPEGGIYSPEDMMNMEKERIINIGGQVLVTGIANTWSQPTPGDPIRPHNLFPNTFPDTSKFSFASAVWNLVEAYGDIMSIIVGTILLGKLCTWITGVALRWINPPTNAKTFMAQVTAVLFPTLYLLLIDFPMKMFDGSSPPSAPSDKDPTTESTYKSASDTSTKDLNSECEELYPLRNPSGSAHNSGISNLYTPLPLREPTSMFGKPSLSPPPSYPPSIPSTLSRHSTSKNKSANNSGANIALTSYPLNPSDSSPKDFTETSQHSSPPPSSTKMDAEPSILPPSRRSPKS